ncbi:unnamed protein product [Lathyrus oleraceus]
MGAPILRQAFEPYSITFDGIVCSVDMPVGMKEHSRHRKNACMSYPAALITSHHLRRNSTTATELPVPTEHDSPTPKIPFSILQQKYGIEAFIKQGTVYIGTGGRIWYSSAVQYSCYR